MLHYKLKEAMIITIVILFFGASFTHTISTSEIDSELRKDNFILNVSSYWAYYRVINLNNPHNHYQMLINISNNSGGDVDCNGHCLDNFGDVRFYDVDNVTVLDYWIEKKVDGFYAWFWVKLPSDVETDQKIIIYYGNLSATSISDGYSTFLWFDDFSIDTTGDWESARSSDNKRTFFSIPINDISYNYFKLINL